MANRYFSYNGDAYQTHETAEDAQREAFKALDFWREAAIADGEWSDEASTIAWGEIREHAYPVTIAPEDEDDVERCDYTLKPVAALDVAPCADEVPRG